MAGFFVVFDILVSGLSQGAIPRQGASLPGANGLDFQTPKLSRSDNGLPPSDVPRAERLGPTLSMPWTYMLSHGRTAKAFGGRRLGS
jgi:hypothetical protein